MAESRPAVTFLLGEWSDRGHGVSRGSDTAVKGVPQGKRRMLCDSAGVETLRCVIYSALGTRWGQNGSGDLGCEHDPGGVAEHSRTRPYADGLGRSQGLMWWPGMRAARRSWAR